MPNTTLTYLWGHIPFPRRVRTALIWLLSPKFTVGVVALVRDHKDHILLLRHTYRLARPWGLPGGGLKPRESLEECLRRELREEIGMEVEIEGLLSAAAHFDRRLVDMIFACHPAPGHSLDAFRPNSEIAEARFFPPDALPKDLTPGMRSLIATAIRQARGEKVPYVPPSGEMP